MEKVGKEKLMVILVIEKPQASSFPVSDLAQGGKPSNGQMVSLCCFTIFLVLSKQSQIWKQTRGSGTGQ